MKKLIIVIITYFACILAFPVISSVQSQQPTSQVQESAQEPEDDYKLPHAGILRDHPLYFLKAIRDKVVTFLQRDNLKRAEYMLLLSDKHIVMSQALAEKGSWDLAIESMKESEEYVSKIIEAVTLAEQIGSAPSADFLQEMKDSSTKHEDILMQLIKKAPENNQEHIEKVIEINHSHYNAMTKL